MAKGPLARPRKSVQHAGNVSLVLNLSTGHVSPQFHVVFDDWFTSANSTRLDDPLDPAWNDLFIHNKYQYIFDDEDSVEIDEQWLDMNNRIQQYKLQHDLNHPTYQRENERSGNGAQTETQPTILPLMVRNLTKKFIFCCKRLSDSLVALRSCRLAAVGCPRAIAA